MVWEGVTKKVTLGSSPEGEEGECSKQRKSQAGARRQAMSGPQGGRQGSRGAVWGGRSVGPQRPLEGFGFTWGEIGGRWKVVNSAVMCVTCSKGAF